MAHAACRVFAAPCPPAYWPIAGFRFATSVCATGLPFTIAAVMINTWPAVCIVPATWSEATTRCSASHACSGCLAGLCADAVVRDRGLLDHFANGCHCSCRSFLNAEERPSEFRRAFFCMQKNVLLHSEERSYELMQHTKTLQFTRAVGQN